MPARLHNFADVIVATIGGGLVLLVFYPLTLSAAGVKHVVRAMRPRLGEHRRSQSMTQY